MIYLRFSTIKLPTDITVTAKITRKKFHYLWDINLCDIEVHKSVFSPSIAAVEVQGVVEDEREFLYLKDESMLIDRDFTIDENVNFLFLDNDEYVGKMINAVVYNQDTHRIKII